MISLGIIASIWMASLCAHVSASDAGNTLKATGDTSDDFREAYKSSGKDTTDGTWRPVAKRACLVRRKLPHKIQRRADPSLENASTAKVDDNVVEIEEKDEKQTDESEADESEADESEVEANEN